MFQGIVLMIYLFNFSDNKIFMKYPFSLLKDISTYLDIVKAKVYSSYYF